MRSERWSEKPEDVGSLPSSSTNMSVWRNRQTRMVEVHMSQGVEVQVLSWTPLFSRSKEKRDARLLYLKDKGRPKYASLAQLDRATAF